MAMDYNDNISTWKKFLRSFKFALRGIGIVFTKEFNFVVHVVTSLAVIAAGFAFSISQMEWLIIVVLISGMFSLEMLNTAIERTVDLVTKEYHPLAEQAKDIAAGAVLCYAAGAVIIGMIIFLPKLIKLF